MTNELAEPDDGQVTEDDIAATTATSLDYVEGWSRPTWSACGGASIRTS